MSRTVLGVLFVYCSLAFLASFQEEEGGRTPASALVLHDEGYVGSDACVECHRSNHASWRASYHSRMTQSPSGEAVLAPWRGVTPLYQGSAWALVRQDEAFLARSLDENGRPNGPVTRLALTTGSHHYQIYWLATAEGVLEQLPLVWHVGEQAWVPRNAMFLRPPGHTHAETDRWQAVCIKCHTTNGTPVHPEFGATRVAELGIACEACHGPGEAHVAWRRAEHPEGEPEPDTGIVDPSELDHVRSTQVCGQCHGIHLFGDPDANVAWMESGFEFRPGDDLGATRNLLRGERAANPEGLRAYLERNPGTLESLFWGDAQVRVSGREYNGMVESPCYQRGEMSCLSCHEMHVSEERVASGWAADQLRVGRDGPAACTQCHAEYAEAEVLAAHTHHAPDSSGSDCLNCHMPYTTYGLTKGIRSHTIASPDVAAELAAGKPSACNQCHLDRPLGWTADRLAEWYGHPRPELPEVRETTADVVVQALAGDAGLRALAAWNLTWAPARAVAGTGWMPYLVSTLAQDEYDAVRWIAMFAARLEPGRADFTLDACAPWEEQREHVTSTLLEDWLRAGLRATDEQRAAVLVREDGTLDEPRFRALWEARDRTPVLLAE